MGKKKQKHQSMDELLKGTARENNSMFPTQHATLRIGGSSPTTEAETNRTISHPNSSSSKHDVNDHFSSRQPTIQDHQEPASKTLIAEHNAGSNPKEGKKRKERVRKDTKHDNDTVEQRREEKGDAAQVEGKGFLQSTSEFDGMSDVLTTRSGHPSSTNPMKVHKDGSEESRKSKAGITAGDKEGRSSGSRPTGSRVFTEEDDIILLQGTIDCGLSHNVPASSVSVTVLHEFLDGKLHSDFNKTQIYEKIRRLKQKFVKTMKMHESSGVEGPLLLKPHEAMAFELSKKIWGGQYADDYSPISSKNHLKDWILVEDSGNSNVKKGKKNLSKGKSSAGKFGATEAAAALDSLKDGEGHDNNGKKEVQNGHVKDDKLGEVSMRKKRWLEEIETAKKKLKLSLELAKLEFEELKKG